MLRVSSRPRCAQQTRGWDEDRVEDRSGSKLAVSEKGLRVKITGLIPFLANSEPDVECREQLEELTVGSATLRKAV